MKPKKYRVKLKKKDREYLEKFISIGVRSAREIKRAKILLLSDEKVANKEITKQLGATPVTIRNIEKKYCTEGLEAALKEKPRPGQPKKVFKETETAIIALACSEAPEGRKRWTMRLLKDKIILLEIVDSISYVQVSRILKKLNLNLGSKNNGALDE